MNDSTDNLDKLAKYRRPGQKSLVAKPVSARKADEPYRQQRPYEAYRIGKESKRHLELRLRFPDPSECPPNSMITNIRGEWRRGLAITIIYGKTMVIQIKGRNLQELFQAIKDSKVEWIEEFDVRFHLSVKDGENAPFIKSIAITTPTTEEAPPMNQRH